MKDNLLLWFLNLLCDCNCHKIKPFLRDCYCLRERLLRKLEIPVSKEDIDMGKKRKKIEKLNTEILIDRDGAGVSFYEVDEVRVKINEIIDRLEDLSSKKNLT